MLERGYAAFETACALQLHLTAKGYDGWKYNFRTKAASKRFTANPQTKFVYAKIERDYPTKLEQLRFLYPYISKYGFKVNLNNARLMQVEYDKYTCLINDIERKFGLLIAVIKQELGGDFSLILDQSDMLPKIYQLYDTQVIKNVEVLLLFMAIPALNSTSSNEPFVFDKWKDKILFDIKMLSMYITPPMKSMLAQMANDELNGKLNDN